jgi:putative salt-induced outer membrane protein
VTIRSLVPALAAMTLLAAAAAAQAVAPKTSFTGDLGFVSASGNTELSTLSLADKIVRTDARWTISQLAAYVYGETGHKESANQLRVAARADYALKPRLGLFLGASYDHNPFAGFNSRVDEIGGLVWKAIAASRDSLSVDAGGVLTQERDVDGTSKSYPAARVAGNYKHAFSRATYFQQLAEYLPNLKTSGAYRVNTESAIVAPLSTHVGIKVGYVVRFDSAPPAAFGTTDRVLTTGVQVSY